MATLATAAPPLLRPRDLTFPQPFDTTLSTNFTSLSCPSFIETFVASSSFSDCHAFSLLLGTSNAFFRSYSPSATSAPTSTASLQDTLEASCSAPLGVCASVTSSLALELQRPDRCGNDLAAGNAIAVEALQGLQSYAMMRDAGCLKGDGSPAPATPSASNSAPPSSTTSASPARQRRDSPPANETYCFEQAVASSSPDNLYFFVTLPQGTGLPSGTKPSCDPCLQSLLSTYSKYASNTTLQISNSYPQARSIVNARCGPSFAPPPVLATSSSAAPPRSATILWALVFLSFAFRLLF